MDFRFRCGAFIESKSPKSISCRSKPNRYDLHVFQRFGDSAYDTVSLSKYFNFFQQNGVVLGVVKKKKKKKTNKQTNDGTKWCRILLGFQIFPSLYILSFTLRGPQLSLSHSRLASHWPEQVLATGSLRQTTASIRFNGLSLYSFETLSWFIHLQPQVHCILYLVYTIILSSIPPVTVTYLFVELVYLVYPFMFFSLCFLLLPT